MSRRDKRNNPHKTPPSQRNRNGSERTYQFTEPPPPPPLTDTSRIWICGGPDGQPPEAGDAGAPFQGQTTWDEGRPDEPPPGPDSDGTGQAGFGSRGGRVRAGIRSRLLFPDAVKQLIDERTRAFSEQHSARTLLERWLVGQIAMGTVQGDLARDQLIVNASLAVQRVDTPRWADDRREYSEKLGQRIGKAPCRIAGELGRSKYGALYLIDRLTSLGESIASNGCLDDVQRECLFDHLGVDHVFRNGSQKVPAGSDGPGLAAVVAKEKSRLLTKLERELDARDLQEQAAARLGIVRFRDQETRNLRGDQTRADRRVKWALRTLADVRAGVDPATLIDNETGRPIDPRDPDSPAPEAAKPKPAPPEPPTAPSPEAAAAAVASTSTFRIPAILEGLPEELKQILILMAEAHHRKPAPAGEETPAEAGPVPPA